MDNLRLGILGCGVIGSAIKKIHQSFGHEVIGHDLNLGTELAILLDTNLIFVCLPTPQGSDGTCDLSIVESELRKLNELGYRGTVVMKSTVLPGSGERFNKEFDFNYVSCPEFLREHSAEQDYLSQKIHFIGADCEIENLRLLLKPLSSEIREVTITEAELIKYFHNSYNAWRIIFANAFCELTEQLDTNYDNILKNVSALNDYSENYLRSSSDFKGFGGPCLPKDTAALASLANKLNLRSNVWEFCIEENAKWDTTLIKGLRSEGFK